MKRQRYPQWMQTGLLGIVAGTSVALTPNLVNAQVIEKVQQADESTLSVAEPSVSSAEFPTAQEPVEESVAGSVIPEATQTTTSGSQAVATETESTSVSEDVISDPLKQDTQLSVEQPALKEAVVAEEVTGETSSKTQPAMPTPTVQIEEATQTSDAPITQDKAPSSLSTESSTTVQAPVAMPASGISILTPGPGSVVDKPATTVIIEFGTQQNVELRVNGKVVDVAQVGRTETNSETQRVRQTWYGVILDAGVNTITVNEVGKKTPSATVQVEVPGKPAQIKVRTTQSKVPADGRSTAQVVGFLQDEHGNQSNWNAVVTLEATEGKFIGTDNKPDIPGFQVEAIDGKFTADLQSGIDAGVVRIRATTAKLEGFHQFQFSTPIRPSALLTGAVDVRIGRRGTNFYDSFREFLPIDGDNSYEVDARAQAFGITSIGDWLLTGAFNSARPLNEDCNGESTLFKASGSECDYNNYATYGDNSITDVTAPSTDNLFVRLERTSPVPGAGSDYFMWGDYHTEELAKPSQLFTATSRSLHGFKGNYNIGNLQLTALYGNNTEGFQRDTIAPDGTSGFYFLSRRLLVPGSEEVFLELEELNRPGTVLKRERLSRGADYDVDYDRGTLKFQRPILRTDVDDNGFVLVRRIVATYQFEGENADTDTFGGRAQYTFSRNLDQESWIGATYLRENRGSQDFELYGADALVSFGKENYLIAEYAHSTNSLDFATPVSGDAYRVEVEANPTKDISGRAYFRRADVGFSNNATTSFVPGQTRYGAEIAASVTKNTKLRASYDHEDNFGVAPRPLDLFEELIQPGFAPTPVDPVNNSLTTITAGVLQRIGDAEVSLDYVHRDRTDRLTGDEISSDQLRSTVRVPITRKLTLRALNETTLSSEVDPIYPNRTSVGLEYEVYPGISIGLNNTYLTGGQFDDDFITSLDIAGQHTFSTDTTLRGQFSMTGDLGMAGYFGVEQGLTIAPGLRADFSYEHVFNTSLQQTAASQQFAQPFALGSGASALGLTPGDSFSVGLAYTDNPDFQANARLEYSDTPQGTNTVISANALGRATRDLTVLASYQQASASNQTLTGLGTTRDLKVGLAYRNPDSDKFNALVRYEYRENPSTIPDTILFGSGTGTTDHLLSAEAIYAPNWRWELYGKFGWRHSKSFLAQDLIGTSSISLAQLRATYRLSNRWDIGGEVRWIRQNSTGFNEVGAAAEVGYYLNPNLRLSAGYAFGDVSDRDLGNSRSASGPYFGVTLKLDNNLFKDFGFGNKVAPPQQQESAPEAVKVEQASASAPKRVKAKSSPVEAAPANPRPASQTQPSVKVIR
ncbi:TonB-dependent receptor [Acaryochloris sp. IP29b_bin.137]|uniref:TonB-dependent receptor n=1 Tax=Acaryochloris sp. IP29b_bin.137 TaxID=2969217 RepID=UPI0026020BED|nr:TonB-dependent receptor [Acaryochloris sp. IP29b_bin.137]